MPQSLREFAQRHGVGDAIRLAVVESHRCHCAGCVGQGKTSAVAADNPGEWASRPYVHSRVSGRIEDVSAPMDGQSPQETPSDDWQRIRVDKRTHRIRFENESEAEVTVVIESIPAIPAREIVPSPAPWEIEF